MQEHELIVNPINGTINLAIFITGQLHDNANNSQEEECAIFSIALIIREKPVISASFSFI